MRVFKKTGDIVEQLRPLFLNHMLGCGQSTAPTVADNDASIGMRLVEWRKRKQLYDSVTFSVDGKKKRLPVVPGCLFFQIEKNGTRFAYALEADMGTTNRRTFDDKINAY